MKTYRIKYYQLETGEVFRISDVKSLQIRRVGDIRYNVEQDTFIVIVENYGEWLYVSAKDYWKIAGILKEEMIEIPFKFAHKNRIIEVFDLDQKIQEAIQEDIDELYESHPSYSESFSDRKY